MKTPAIGIHLAGLNLFRESDGSVQITVAEARGAINEIETGKAAQIMSLPADARPIDYVEELIIEAANNIQRRRYP